MAGLWNRGCWSSESEMLHNRSRTSRMARSSFSRHPRGVVRKGHRIRIETRESATRARLPIQRMDFPTEPRCTRSRAKNIASHTEPTPPLRQGNSQGGNQHCLTELNNNKLANEPCLPLSSSNRREIGSPWQLSRLSFRRP